MGIVTVRFDIDDSAGGGGPEGFVDECLAGTVAIGNDGL
jgi:hypothetical protein